MDNPAVGGRTRHDCVGYFDLIFAGFAGGMREPAIERRDGIVAMVLVLATRDALGDDAARLVGLVLRDWDELPAAAFLPLETKITEP